MSSGDKLYKLIGADGKEYLSAEKGTLGGNGRAKIYGRLDCPAALRALGHPAKDVYISSRVFFADEETAIAAGYRPCGSCMRERYRLWKEGRLSAELDNEEK